MSGENALQTVEDLNNAIEQKLDEYRNSRKLNFKYNSNDIEQALQIDKNKLDHMSNEELASNAYILDSYALYLQMELNKAMTTKMWAEHHIKILYGKYAKDYGSQYTSFEERKLMLLTENTHGVKLNKLLLEASLIIEQLYMISAKINALSSTLLKRRTYEQRH